MSVVRYRKFKLAAAILGAGMLFQYLPTGCAQYTSRLAAGSFNWCGVFNCTGGGYFNFCEPFAVFIDCPSLATTTE